MASTFRAAFAAAAALIVVGSAEAQYRPNYPYPPGYPYPVASMHVPPPYDYRMPATVYVDHPRLAPTTYYPIPNPWVGYADPSSMIVAPARVSYGAFGKTYVRTPYYRVGFW